MTGLAGVNKQPPLKRAAIALAHSLTGAPAGLEQRPSHESSHRGIEGEGMVSDSRAKQTSPHHTMPYHARAFFPSLSFRCSVYFLAAVVWFSTQSTIFSPDHSQRLHQSRAEPKEVYLLTPSSTFSFLSVPQTESTALRGPESNHCLKLLQAPLTSRLLGGMKGYSRHIKRGCFI